MVSEMAIGRIGSWAAVLGVGAALGAPAALAATSPSIHVRPHRVPAGDRVRVFGSAGDCSHGDQVTLLSRAFRHRHEFAGVPAVFATVGPHGNYSVRTRIPRKRAAHRYTITARCGGGNLGVEAHLRVL
jgi:hypothetical protein